MNKIRKYADEFVSLLKDVSALSLVEAFDSSIEPIVITNTDWEEGVKIIYVNDAFCRETLYERDEVLDKSPKILQGKNTNREVLKDLKADLQAGKNFVGENTNYKKDGTEYMVEWSISHIKDNQDETVAYMAFQKIVTKFVKAENENFLLKSIVKQSPGMILVTDLESRVVYVNDSFCVNVGYSASELIGHHSRMLKSGKQDNKFYRHMWNILIKTGEYEGVFINRKKDGTIYYDKKKISTIKNEKGDKVYYFSVSYDVTKERRNEKRMLDEIYIDSLTKQFNRKKYEQIIDKKIDEYKKEGKEFSLLILDIDFFKKINDKYGHDKGDYILKEISRLIGTFISKKSDTLFRWGGEEFAILADRTAEEAEDIANILKDMISEYDFDGINVTLSCGIAQMSKELDKNSLFKLSDEALYTAKKSGRNRVVVSHKSQR